MKEFKAESKKILDMMINSIYTHKEVFLRELISNCSDAIDKLYYKGLSQNKTGLNRDDFFITLKVDKPTRTLTVCDNGCGMTEEELDKNLGVIAHSGSLDFKKDVNQNDVNIIGQFGVGFYSSFMVADKVSVLTRADGSDKAYLWESEGADGYTVTEAKKDTCGTCITLHIKDKNTEDDDFDDYLDEARIEGIVKKYSDYIRYPIKTEKQVTKPVETKTKGAKAKDKSTECETVLEWTTLNSMVPLWKKSKQEVSKEDYDTFYKSKYFDYEAPVRVMTSNVEGNVSFNAMMFVPSHAPYNYYSKEYEKGLQLYSGGVLIMERCPDLLPDCFSFVKGLVDSQDLSLNVSREMLQHDRTLKIIAANLEKKIKSELAAMLETERETYEKIFSAFGLQLKFSLYNGFGEKKELLQDLLMFKTMSEGKLSTLAEYVKGFKEDQKYIYYACGKSVEAISHLPQIELIKDKGYEIFCLTDEVDEFVLRIIDKYSDKEFKNVSDGNVGIDDKASAEETKKTKEESKDLLGFVRDALKGKVKDVRVSSRLKNYPVCLSTEGGMSIEMEKVLNSMPVDQKVSAEKILEINSAHPIFAVMQQAFVSDKDKLKDIAKVLFAEAQLIEGLSVDNASEFADLVCKLIK